MQSHPSLSFTLAVTVNDPSTQTADDVLVRGTADQPVSELALRLATFRGHPSLDAMGQPLRYGLRVERTGEQLRPEAAIGSVDLLDGDTLTLLIPRARRANRPRWAEPSVDEGWPAPTTVIPLRPRRRAPNL